MTDPVIRFCRLASGTRVAYSAHGSGPLLVCPAWWVSHLERDWEHRAFRDFFTTLAHHRTVVRYDRPGVGLSDRDRTEFTQQHEVEVLDTIVAGFARPAVDLLAFSCAAPVALVWAASNPESVRKLVLVGAYARGADLGPDAIRDALVSLVEASWGMGAAAINRLFSPDLSGDEARSLGRDQLASASAATAAGLLGLNLTLDARKAAVRVNRPALVIHRRGDHTVRFDLGRDLAAELPNATLLPLSGRAHLPWLGDAEPVLAATVAFLNDLPAEEVAAVSPSWQRSGDTWTIRFGARTIHVRHAKGLADLGVLLSRPGLAVEALELYAGPAAPGRSASQPVVDRQALVAYRAEAPEEALVTDTAASVARAGESPMWGSVQIGAPGFGVAAPVGVHRAVGGRHDRPVPGDFLCAALVTCLDSTIRIISNNLGVPLESLEVAVQADVDLRGTLLVEPTVEVGFNNMFEVPVLFFVACTPFISLGAESLPALVLAWLFVSLRYLHAFIHLTYNHFLHRMLAFWASFVCALLLWADLVLRQLSQ